MILVIDGGYRIGIDPCRGFDAGAGDLVIMRPEIDHAWTTADHPRGAREGVMARFVLLRPPLRIELMLLRQREIHPHYSLQRIGPGPHRRRMVRCFRQMETDDPMDRRVRRAIEHMAGRLSEPRTIDAIAASVGFCDAKHFARRFRAIAGTAPSEYRRRDGREL